MLHFRCPGYALRALGDTFIINYLKFGMANLFLIIEITG